jgi:transcriptional regulator with XRE-family HTH domain
MHTDSLDQIVARNVAKAMEAAGENPSSVAAKTGIHRSTITRRLTGKSSFKTNELQALAQCLDTTPAALMVVAA